MARQWEFDAPVFVSKVEIGENRGMGAGVGILALDTRDPLANGLAAHNGSQKWFRMWSGEADPSIADNAVLFDQYYLNQPEGVCWSPFKTNVIRYELNTRVSECGVCGYTKWENEHVPVCVVLL